MQSKQRQRIIARHKSSLYQHGYSPQALFWKDQQVQEKRFDVLFECGVEDGDSVLDVGCGLADLDRFIKKKGIKVNYTGIDLSPDMINTASLRDPSLTLFAGDIFDLNPADGEYDWVLLSGALNEPLKDNGDYLKRVLPRLFRAAGKGLAFNLLDARYNWTERELCTLQPYDPDEVVVQLSELTAKVEMRDDYLENDVTFFAWHK